MSANIRSMMYYGNEPWHKLGKKVDHLLTSAEAIDAAGLNYKVEKRDIKTTDDLAIPDHFATVRTDTNEVLGVVGNKYTVLQNRDAFSFFDAVVSVKDAMFETAGALGVGEKIWMLAKLPGYIRTVGDDVTEKYLLLSNSHDGSGSVQVMFTPIRVVCQNTLNIAMAGGIKKQKIRHTFSMGSRVEDVRRNLGIIHEQFNIFEQATKQLASVQVQQEALAKFVKDSGLIPDDLKMSTRAKNIIDDVSTLFETGKGADLPGAKGTVWGAFNAVVEYVDYRRGGDNKENRANSLLFGSGAIVKQKAFDAALLLAK